jgi:hypothetical protein
MESDIKKYFQKKKWDIPENLSVTEIGKNAHLGFRQIRNSYPIRDPQADGSLENISKGCEDHLIDLTIGLDFGTSSLKAMVWNDATNMAVPIRFVATSGINAYLLPCEFYEDENGLCNLSGRGKKYSDLKLNLLFNWQDLTNQQRAVAYLALALKKIRAYIFEHERDQVIQSEIVWRLNVGLPSDACHETLKNLWTKIAKAAWMLSVHEDVVRIKDAQNFLKLTDQFEEYTSMESSALKVIPEFQAEVYAIVDTDGTQSNYKPYAVIDIGAGTTDIAVFFLTRGYEQSENSVYIQAAQITQDGLAVLHSNRVKAWQNSLCNFAVKTPPISIDQAKQISNLWDSLSDEALLAPWSRLPDKCEEYLQEVTTSGSTPDTEVWKKFNLHVVNNLHKGYKNAERPTERMPIYVIGGGASHRGYYEAAKRAISSEPSSYELRDYFPEFQHIEKDVVRSIKKENIWQRLAVSYGLAKGFFGIIKFETEKKKEQRPTLAEIWRDNYIRKEDV